MCLYTADGNSCTVEIFANQSDVHDDMFPDDINAFVASSALAQHLAGNCFTFTVYLLQCVDDCPRGFHVSIPFQMEQ